MGQLYIVIGFFGQALMLFLPAVFIITLIHAIYYKLKENSQLFWRYTVVAALSFTLIAFGLMVPIS